MNVNSKENQLRKQLVDALENQSDCQQWRPSFHLSPPVGLLNDPNGFIFHEGRYHLFYQWNPFECGHGPKLWGHVSSENLCDWEHHPVALFPSEDYETHGCYSGSAIAQDGVIQLFYTGNVKFADGGRTAWQCRADVSGDTVTKQGPVLGLPEGYTGHVRDPKVWKHSDGHLYMVLAAQDKDEQGKVLLYRSENSKAWNLLGEMAGSRLNGLNDFGYMWECPDLFRLEDKDILLVCPQGLAPEGDKYNNLFQCGYFQGQLNYESAEYTYGDFHELDAGFDFYAPQTTEDDRGRRLMFGWLGLPDENESTHPSIEHNWLHCMSLPRELTLKNGQVYQRPVDELAQLRDEQLLNGGMKNTIFVPEAFELKMASAVKPFHLSLRNTAVLSWDGKKLILERKNWRTGQWEQRRCDCSHIKGIHIFHDSSTLEIFVNNGSIVMSSRIFPEIGEKTLSFECEDFCFGEMWSLHSGFPKYPVGSACLLG